MCVISWYKCAWLHTHPFLYTPASVYSITNYGPICVLFDLSVIIAFFVTLLLDQAWTCHDCHGRLTESMLPVQQRQRQFPTTLRTLNWTLVTPS